MTQKEPGHTREETVQNLGVEKNGKLFAKNLACKCLLKSRGIKLSMIIV